jgi:hypothetical protein
MLQRFRIRICTADFVLAFFLCRFLRVGCSRLLIPVELIRGWLKSGVKAFSALF